MFIINFESFFKIKFHEHSIYFNFDKMGNKTYERDLQRHAEIQNSL